MNIIHLSRAEYQTLSTTGTLTKSGVTYTFDPINNEYVVPDTSYMHTLYGVVGTDDAYFDGTIKIINKNPTPYLFNTIEHQSQATITLEELAKCVLCGGEIKSYGNTIYRGAFNILPGGKVELMDEAGYHQITIDFFSFQNGPMTDTVAAL